MHSDLFGNVLFAGAAPPAVVGFSLYWHPREWAAEWPQMLLRALLFRAAVHAGHPRSSAQSLAGLEWASALVRGLL